MEVRAPLGTPILSSTYWEIAGPATLPTTATDRLPAQYRNRCRPEPVGSGPAGGSRGDPTGRCDRCGSLDQSRGVRTGCLEVGDVLQGGLCDGGEGFSREESLVAGDNHGRKRQQTLEHIVFDDLIGEILEEQVPF